MGQQWVAAYRDVQSATTMAEHLADVIDKDDIHIITQSDQSLFVKLRGRLRDSDSGFDYEEILSQGGALLIVDVDNGNMEHIQRLMNGGSYTEEQQSSVSTTSSATPVRRDTDEDRIELVEEQLQIGKREVEGGSVRVRTHVVEEPVSEEVRLREERVNLERHAVDRPLSGDEDLFQERTIEVTERREEPVIAKQARVVEEVVISKDVQERTETVSDTVRRTEVEIDRDTSSSDRYGYSQYASTYRQDFDRRYANSGRTFDYYSPAYELGHRLAHDERYTRYGWDELEPSARTYWETNHREQGAWDNFRDAVQHAWQSARNR